MFTGAITALATPISNEHVDRTALQELVEFQIGEGIDGLVPCGTTGEAATLSAQERSLVIRTVVDQTRKRVPVIAGASANCTKTAVQNSKMAAEAGADGLLHVTPYYNKPTAAGLLAHFEQAAAATKLPVIIYNVPSRTGCDMQPDTVAEIANIPNVVGIKEATGSIARGQQVLLVCPDSFVVLSGDDATCMALTAVGGHGVISVVANLKPGAVSRMISLARSGQLNKAQELNRRLLPLMDLLFVQPNPIPVKAALSLMGFAKNEVRLPLLPLSGEKLEMLRAEMERQGLLS